MLPLSSERPRLQAPVQARLPAVWSQGWSGAAGIECRLSAKWLQGRVLAPRPAVLRWFPRKTVRPVERRLSPVPQREPATG